MFSNGEYRAPEHRVRASDSQVHSSERFSAPFFLNPPYESVVAPLVVKRTVDDTGQVVVTTREPKYSPLVWGEFRRRRFEGDYADFGREIQIEDFQWKQLDEAKA